MKCITNTRRSCGVTIRTDAAITAGQPPSPLPPRLSSRRTPLPPAGSSLLSPFARSALALYTAPAFVTDGGLMSYGIEQRGPYRRAAGYVEKGRLSAAQYLFGSLFH